MYKQTDVYAPTPIQGGVHICIGADPWRLCSFVFVHYFLTQGMDFDQSCIHTLLGGERVDWNLMTLTLFISTLKCEILTKTGIRMLSLELNN